MGLGLTTRTPLRRSKSTRHVSSIVSAEELANAFYGCVRSTPLQPFFSAHATNADTNGFALQIHPTEEPVFVDFDGEWATLSAKTSTAGPGYHAYLVSCMDRVQQSLGLRWVWDSDEVGEFVDETEFYVNRDFEDLQHRMADQLRAIARVFEQHVREGHTGLQIGMAIDFRPEADKGEVLTQLGPITAHSLRDITQRSGSELHRVVGPYYAWWGQGFDGNFFRGLALTSMWMHMRWRHPPDPEDLQTAKWTLGWCEEADRLGADPPVPQENLSVLQAYILSGKTGGSLPESRIGYRRRFLNKTVCGNWTFCVPGDLEESVQKDQLSVVFSNRELAIRVSCLAAQPDSIGESAAGAQAAMIETNSSFNPAADGDGYELNFTAERNLRAGAKDVLIMTIWMSLSDQRPLAARIVQTVSYRDDFGHDDAVDRNGEKASDG